MDESDKRCEAKTELRATVKVSRADGTVDVIEVPASDLFVEET